jgi:hypothetical protein
MIGLINKVDKLLKEDIASVQAVVDKYAAILQLIEPENQIPYYAYLINACVNHLEEHYNNISADWKAWSVLVIKHFYEHKKIGVESDIPPVIDEFLEYKEKEYDKYCVNMVSATEYNRDSGFMYAFIKKKNQ